jgi:hypothetical protein
MTNAPKPTPGDGKGAAPGVAPTPKPAAPPPPPPPPQPTERRGRGRPSNASKGEAATPPPAEGAKARPDAEQPRGRKGNATPNNVSKLADKLVIYHRMLATFSKMPELMITRDDALLLAESGLAVADEFDLEIGGRWAVLGAFVLTAGGIYAPRAIMVAARMERMRSDQQRQRNGGPTIDGEPVT